MGNDLTFSKNPFPSGEVRPTYHGPRPVVTIILDGWGIGPDYAGNAIRRAQTPNLDSWWLQYPHGQLIASGQAVGLPEGDPGNTEAGHLNMGAGTIMYQDLPRITASILDGSFARNGALVRALEHVKQHNSKLHLLGLVGAGVVHANVQHLYELLTLAQAHELTKVYVHAITDGRDSPPTDGVQHLQALQAAIAERCPQAQIATLMGRYYAMDRDQRWDRIEKAYHALTLARGNRVTDPVAALRSSYKSGITDEFVEPSIISLADGSSATTDDDDAVIFFNYRIDRPRELTRAFVLADFESSGGSSTVGFDPYSQASNLNQGDTQATAPVQTFIREKKVNNLYFVTMTQYEKHLPVDVAFMPQLIDNPLPKILAARGLRQLRIAETEKERFVTYYLNGASTEVYAGEDRLIVPSKGTTSYDKTPEMSALEITNHAVTAITSREYDWIFINYANADMVGHTGNLEATIHACELLDQLLGEVVTAVLDQQGVVLISADHGNAEEMIDRETGAADTEHSRFPVPLLIIGPQYQDNPIQLPEGVLADIAPTTLSIMGIPIPGTMTGRALL